MMANKEKSDSVIGLAQSAHVKSLVKPVMPMFKIN